MKLTDEQVRHVAKLARLALSDEEVATFRRQLSEILVYVDQLAELDVSEVEPTLHAVPLSSPLRADEPAPSIGTEEALANAPAAAGSSFKVPKVIDS